jgi:hypothetical protein
MRRVLAAVSAAVILLFVMHSVSTACPSCYGDPAAPMTEGLNWAILSLLGVTGGVLTGLGGFFLFLRSRIRGEESVTTTKRSDG